ncbi:sn-glycerol-3-phosphate ABC transporter ATP-binding protein UgpC [Aureimonas fodinaquatilis]|uniref:sn-glycerol-3-phosphate ABC transporter ATP-binding protein UgpC n=1 Tax=Aureimonas fodinaquatilis TaxID=2565783 RepID=A0A5B0DVJ0_9HYPH|nr:sn-glycerol-3-phosphate ABC transporter ATP-binding protein UgpC [Aureimonas fodinaquatilis]KAA0970754.1 sn-glycerol-3-phosphate ABC transporter ATP-binding protein UgpC [Aureimonas fodinaquatilis]
MANLSVDNVGKFYGSHEAMKNVSVEIADGEFVILVGPSGCGKSTLLRMIAGLEAISSGTIRIDDTVVNELPPKERDIAMVFQSYALYPHMTVAQNMGFALKIQGTSRQEIQTKVSKAAGILSLETLLDRYPRQLSGGQRQRVAMGRAIVRDPKIFLFDEPLSNLDAKLRVQMRSEIKELHQRLKTTIVYVTHDQVEAMTMADKIVVMRDGVIEQIGPPIELYDSPENLFVAGFIGSPSMNLIKGKAAEAGFCTLDGLIVPYNDRVPPEAVTYGIRPEHIIIDHSGVPVEVAVVEPTGSETQLIMRMGEQLITGVFRTRLHVRAGDKIAILPEAGHAHFFDRQGRRIS